ncbi:MAG: alpha/beta hydrolase [Actinoplanes sp.]
MARPLRAAVLTITTLLAYGGPPVIQAQATPSPAIRWAACPEEEKVQCGSLTVPADWAKPAGPKTTLAIARRPAGDPKQRVGALFVNPGGPGGSAIDFTFGSESFFGAEVSKRFDIIGMDPRGVGRSSPVLCSQDLVDAKPSPLIDTPQQYAAVLTYNRRLAADCASRTGAHFAHVDTRSVAQDMDAVRAALGLRQLSFYGASYGTLLGQEYAQLYPSRVRALVLDSVMDHSVDLAKFMVQETDAAQDSFNQFIAWCTRDTRCVLRGQDIRQLWSRVATRAKAGTLEDPYNRPVKLGLAKLIAAAFAAFYDPQWYSFAYYLRDAAGQVPTGRIAPQPIDVIDHSFPAVVCEDWRLPITGFADLSNRMRVLRGRAPQMLASPLALDATVGCLGWPSPPDNPQRALVHRPTLPPVLLINARHDPATAYPWSRQVAAQFGPSTRLITYQGWGHVIYKRSPCIRSVTDRYLVSLQMPPGHSCPAVEPEPFGVG